MADKLVIREMTTNDVRPIIDIDKRIEGDERSVTWQQKVSVYLEGHPFKCLVCEINGEIVGFLMADVRGWEYGLPPTGWLEMIGVSPEHRGKGVGRALVMAFLDMCCDRGIKSMNAMVKDSDSRLRDFLEAIGFKNSHMIILEHET